MKINPILNKKNFIRLSLVTIPFLIAIYIIIDRDLLFEWFFELDLSGRHYVGKGQVEIEFEFENLSYGKLNEKNMVRDAVRLNELTSSSDKWFLDFNDVPVKLRQPALQPTVMYISIQLDEPPAGGTFKSGFWSGPEAFVEIWSQDSSGENAVLVSDFNLGSGHITFNKAEIKEEGKMTGTFVFQRGRKMINGRFDLVLDESHLSLFAPWH